jgi:N-acetylgalactosamine-6-sulfatase
MHPMKYPSLPPLAVLLVSLCIPIFANAAEERSPNIVFLLADDLGWGDLSCHGSSFIKTPNIDGLARQGTDFRQFYTTSPVCSPSRAGFMTGRFPARFRIHTAIGGVRKNVDIGQVDWLDPQAVTLPRLLQGAGYVTGHFGKWHLQSGQADDAPLPGAYGVDESALFAGTSHPDAERTIEHDEIWDAAADFIRRHRDRPFFVNVWMHETHLAHYPSEESLALNQHLDERQRIYAAVATDADRGVGRILGVLDELGLAGETIVIFSSDNGPENTHASMLELRGGYGGYYSVGETGGHRGRKRSLYDGGTSTPFIVRWPGHVPAGRVDESSVLSATDLLPTLCAAVGVELPTDYAGDGESVLAAWEGGEFRRSRPIFWDWNGTDRPPTNWPRWAVRDGDWKLLVNDDGMRKELYQVSEDGGESNDLAKEHPEQVSELAAQLEAWRESLPAEIPADCVSRRRR